MMNRRRGTQLDRLILALPIALPWLTVLLVWIIVKPPLVTLILLFVSAGIGGAVLSYLPFVSEARLREHERLHPSQDPNEDPPL